MGNIYKGTIAGIEGNTARVLPSDAGAKPTAKIVIRGTSEGAQEPHQRHTGGVCRI